MLFYIHIQLKNIYVYKIVKWHRFVSVLPIIHIILKWRVKCVFLLFPFWYVTKLSSSPTTPTPTSILSYVYIYFVDCFHHVYIYVYYPKLLLCTPCCYFRIHPCMYIYNICIIVASLCMRKNRVRNFNTFSLFSVSLFKVFKCFLTLHIFMFYDKSFPKKNSINIQVVVYSQADEFSLKCIFKTFVVFNCISFISAFYKNRETQNLSKQSHLCIFY